MSAALISFEYVATSASGGTLTGTFGWDDSVRDSNGSATIGWYRGAGFLTGSVTGGPQDGASFELTDMSAIVALGLGRSGRMDAVGLLGMGAMARFALSRNGGGALGSDTLPTSLDLANIDSAVISLASSATGVRSAGRTMYTIRRMAPVHAPEPGTFALVGIGVAALGAARARRRKRRRAQSPCASA